MQLIHRAAGVVTLLAALSVPALFACGDGSPPPPSGRSDSSHYIQVERPQVVIDAVEQVVGAVRHASPAASPSGPDSEAQ